jgi:hypothetical protein
MQVSERIVDNTLCSDAPRRRAVGIRQITEHRYVNVVRADKVVPTFSRVGAHGHHRDAKPAQICRAAVEIRQLFDAVATAVSEVAHEYDL